MNASASHWQLPPLPEAWRARVRALPPQPPSWLAALALALPLAARAQMPQPPEIAAKSYLLLDMASAFTSVADYLAETGATLSGAAALSPDGSQAYVPAKQDNILRGAQRDGQSLNFQNTVRAISARIELGSGQEDLAGRIDHDNASVASASISSVPGNTGRRGKWSAK